MQDLEFGFVGTSVTCRFVRFQMYVGLLKYKDLYLLRQKCESSNC